MMRKGTMAALCLALASCAPTSESEGGGGSVEQPFVFSSFAEPSFTVKAVDESGQPLQGLSVSVEDVYLMSLDDDSPRGHNVYLRGLTDASGRFTATARLPEGIDAVDIVMHDDAGRIGPWTDADLRDALGYHGPSSRLTRAAASGNVAVSVMLEADPL